MKIIGLLSGGKDSIFGLMHSVAAGHKVVAIALFLHFYLRTNSFLERGNMRDHANGFSTRLEVFQGANRQIQAILIKGSKSFINK